MYFLMINLILVHLSSSEIINCMECGQRFDTIDALNEHEKSEKEEKEFRTRDFEPQKIGPVEHQRL